MPAPKTFIPDAPTSFVSDRPTVEQLNAPLEDRGYQPARSRSARSEALRQVPLMNTPFVSPGVTAGQMADLAPLVLGGAGAAIGGMPGATIGGMVGRGLGDAMTLDFPSDFADFIRRYGLAGAEQGAMQAPASALQTGGRALMGTRDWARQRAVGQAIKESDARVLAKRQAKSTTLKAEVPAATQARRQASAATEAAIKASPEKITVDDLVAEIVSGREQRFGVQIAPKVRQQIVNEVRSRIARVVPTYTGRAVSGKRLVFDMPTAQIAKQAFDDIVRSAHTGVQGGVKPRPSVDYDIANAWRSLIEQRVPDADKLNKATQAAIREEQSVKRLAKGLPTERAARVKDAERHADLKAKVLSNRSANPLKLVSAIPVRGSLAPPGVALRPGTLAEFGGKVGETIASPASYGSAFAGPRIIALLRMLQEQQDPFGMYVAPPDSLTPP